MLNTTVKSLAAALLISLAAYPKVGLAIQTEKRAKTTYVSPVKHVTEEQCLARAISAEAGNQSIKGQLLVANVVINRTKHYKQTVCQVVSAKGQFSWYKGKHSLELDERSKSFLPMSRQILLDIKHGKFVNYAGKNIMWFHNHSVKPKWRHSVKVAVVEGSHTFYYKGV
jgi:spore germination cell wall hydrolase CwlJ-like protein